MFLDVYYIHNRNLFVVRMRFSASALALGLHIGFLTAGDAQAQAPTITQAKVMAMTVLDIFTQKDSVSEMRNAFANVS